MFDYAKAFDAVCQGIPIEESRIVPLLDKDGKPNVVYIHIPPVEFCGVLCGGMGPVVLVHPDNAREFYNRLWQMGVEFVKKQHTPQQGE